MLKQLFRFAKLFCLRNPLPLTHSKKSKRSASLKLRLEQLEDRTVLSGLSVLQGPNLFVEGNYIIGLSAPTITYGTASTTISGGISQELLAYDPYPPGSAIP